MKKILGMCFLSAATMLMSACGGGGGGTDGSASTIPDPVIRVEILTSTTEVLADVDNAPVSTNSPYIQEVNVKVSWQDGSAIADGTVVNGTIAPVDVAALHVLDDPESTDVNEFTTYWGNISSTTSGGLAKFFVHGVSEGVATFTASATNPQSNATVTAQETFTVTVENEPLEHIVIEATKTSLPSNTFGVAPFSGSPFMSEVTVTVLDATGSPVTAVDGLSVSINPVTIAAFSTLDDGETEDINEFEVLLGSGSVNITAGKSTIFVHSDNEPGTATLSLSTIDPVDGSIHEASVEFTIVESGSNGLPSQITATVPNVPQYIQGSGGLDSKQFEIYVTDGASQPVPNPDGFNNVRLSVVSDATNSGETLTGTDNSGNAVTGPEIHISTTSGIASAVLRSGTSPGVITVKTSVDRADNNVDNGIQEEVSDLRDFVISDGRLHSLEIVSPNINAIFANLVDPDVNTNPDGTYSLTISALGTDRLGNPVLPGTEIAFNVIDSPAIGYPENGSGIFVLSGSDGDPEENGRGFVAPAGAFLDDSIFPDHAVEIGDALMLFGEEIAGNHDHESVRIVSEVLSNTNLNVSTDFNPNNDTGAIVNDGDVIPYVIGRSQNVNITGNAFTDDLGVASTTLNYPSNNLGRAVVVSAQGNGVETNAKAEIKTVADVESMVLPGIADATFSVFATQIPANATVDIAMCLSDAQLSDISGVFVGFIVNNSAGGIVTVDGIQNSGYVQQATDESGCTVATVSSSAVPPAADDIVITFFVGSLTGDVSVVAPTGVILFAIPNAYSGDRTETVILSLVDGNGVGQEGIQIVSAGCEVDGPGSVQVLVPPGVTDENGETFTQLRSSGLSTCDGGGTAVCTFTGPNGEPAATVSFTGYDLSAFGASPSCP